jgi:anaerobic selenocysteine-containing dehydrogenase
MKVRISNGKLRMIEPDPQNRATPEGVCLKGLSYIERVYSPDRILFPLKRIGSSSRFEKIDWQTTFDILSDKLEFFRTKSGVQSILYYSGSGTKGLLNAVGMNFWRLFGGCTTTYGDLCWPAGLEATRLTLGDNKHTVPWDMANARLIILWGKNPAETNIHQMYYINQALEKGAKLVVIDPRRTQSAERADILIQPRPGTDGALALAISHLLFKKNKIDHDFIGQYVLGGDDFAEMVAAYSPSTAAEICEIPEKLIHQLADYFSAHVPVTINGGFGMQRYTNSGQTMRAIIALLAITGNIGKPGAGWIFANLQSHIFDKVKDPVAFYPPEKADKKVRISISTTRLGQDILDTQNPPIKMIWVERGNPVTQNPDTNLVLKAFRSVDFRVVVEQFMTDTAREADLILPAKTMFEQSDVIGAYWHPYVQLKQKVIDPPGEVKPESEIYYELARRLGYPVNEMSDLIPEPGDESIDNFLKSKLQSFPDITMEKLRAGPILAPQNQEIAFEDFIFNTPSGKIELFSEQAVKMWQSDPLPVFNEAVESNPKVKTSGRKYKYHFMTPNTKNRIHSQFNNLQLIKNFSDAPRIHIHPQDAREKNISNQDKVRIFNSRGELTLPAFLDFALKPGCVSVTNGWWISEGGTVNFCSKGRETDMGHGAAFHDNLVDLERV